jgi:hypothetical protein
MLLQYDNCMLHLWFNYIIYDVIINLCNVNTRYCNNMTTMNYDYNPIYMLFDSSIAK